MGSEQDNLFVAEKSDQLGPVDGRAMAAVHFKSLLQKI